MLTKIFLREVLILITTPLIDCVFFVFVFLAFLHLNHGIFPIPYPPTSYQSQILLLFLPKIFQSSFNFSCSLWSPLISSENSHICIHDNLVTDISGLHTFPYSFSDFIPCFKITSILPHYLKIKSRLLNMIFLESSLIISNLHSLFSTML